MLSKSFAASIFLVALTSSVNAQIAVKPVLGGPATPGASDVQHPGAETPCGSTNIPQYVDTSSCVPADASGSFTLDFSNFGSGAPPTISTMKVNNDGTGKSFVSGQVPKVSSTQITGQLPSGINCNAGPDKNRCVVSFTASDGTGNCVLVSQPTDGTKVTKDSPSPSPNAHDSVKGNVGNNDNGKGSSGNTSNGNTSNTGTGNGNTSNTPNGSKSTGNKLARMHSRDFKRDDLQ